MPGDESSLPKYDMLFYIEAFSVLQYRPANNFDKVGRILFFTSSHLSKVQVDMVVHQLDFIFGFHPMALASAIARRMLRFAQHRLW